MALVMTALLLDMVPFLVLLFGAAWAKAPMDEENIHIGVVYPFSGINDGEVFFPNIILAHLDWGKQQDPPLRPFYFGCYSSVCPGFNESLRIPPALPISNPHPDLFKLKLHFADTGVIPNRGARIAIEFAFGDEAKGYAPMNAVLGAFEDSVTAAVGNILTLEKVVQVNTISSVEDFRDKTDYPYLFRTGSSNLVVGLEVWDYITYFGWRGAHVFYEEHPFGLGARSGLADGSAAVGRGASLSYYSVSLASAGSSTSLAVPDILASQHRLIVLLTWNDIAFGPEMRTVLHEAGVRSPNFQFLATIAVQISINTVDEMANHSFWHAYTSSQDFNSPSVAAYAATWFHMNAAEDIFSRLPEYTARWDPPYDISKSSIIDAWFRRAPPFFNVLLDQSAALHLLFNAFNTMLHDGYRAPDLRGDLLKAYLMNVSFVGYGRHYGFNEFQDTSTSALLLFYDTPVNGQLSLAPFGLRVPTNGLNGMLTTIPGVQPPKWANGERSWLPPVELSGCTPGYHLVKTDPSDVGTCELCPGGRYSDIYNAETCTECAGGTASTQGSTECANCGAGNFAAAGSIECTSCFPGSFTLSSGMSACASCSVGEFQNASGQTACLKCPPGSHAASARSEACSACNPGTASRDWGQEWCGECLPGSFQDQKGASTCAPCQPGSFSLDSSQAECSRCRPGTFQPNSSSSQGCESCPIGTYVAAYGASECTTCQHGTTRVLGADRQSLCTCPVGTFLYETASATPDANLTSSQKQCLPCNEYMEPCAGGESPGIQKSGYHMTPDAKHVYLCVTEDACPGGLLGTCPRGSSGAGCATCDEGTHFWDGSECAECGDAQGFIIIISPFLVLACFIGTYRFGNDPIGQSLSEISEFIVLAGLSLSVLFFFSSFSGFDVEWKEPVKTMMGISRMLQTELTNVNVSCSFTWGPAASMALTSSIPGLIAVICCIVAWCDRSRAKKLFNTFASIVYAVFLPLLLHALKPFRYIVHPMDSGKSLLFLPSVSEGSSEHESLMVVGIFVVLLYVVPFAAACVTASILIQRSKYPWRRRWYLVTFRFLFYKFNRNAFYWGCTILFRNTAFGLAPSLFPEHPSIGLFFLAAVAIVSAIHTGVVLPWRAIWMNYVDISILAYVALVLNLATGWVRSDSDSEGALATFLAVVAGAGVTFGCLLVAKLLLAIACASKQKREQMRQAQLAKQQRILKDMGSFLGLEDQNLEVANALDSLNSDGMSEDGDNNKLGKGIPAALEWVSHEPFDIKEVAHIVQQIRQKDYSLKCFHEDCVNAFPELLLYNASNEGIPEKEGGRRTSNSGNGQQEQLRTFGALFSIYWICRLDIDGKRGLSFGVKESNQHKLKDVPQDINPKELKTMNWGKMTPEQRRANLYWNFEWDLLRDLFGQAGILVRDSSGKYCLDSRPDGKLVAMICLTAFHDIMKNPGLCPTVSGEPYGEFQVGETIHDHDMALAYILDRHPNALPSFRGLTPEQRRTVRFTQSEMGFNAGWLVQAEGPPSALLSRLKKAIVAGSAKDEDVAFYFSHWVTDLAGAEPTPWEGTEKFAVKFPPHVLQGLLGCFATVKSLADKSETEVYEEYLVERWKQVSDTFGPVPTGYGRTAKLRLLCMGQHAAKQLLDAWELIPAKDKSLLVGELGETGLEGQTFTERDGDRGPMVGIPFLLYYGPAWCQRVGQQHPDLCLRVLASVFRQAREVFQDNGTDKPFMHGHRTIQVGCLKTLGLDDFKEVYEVASDTCMEVRKSNEIEGELLVNVVLC